MDAAWAQVGDVVEANPQAQMGRSSLGRFLMRGAGIRCVLPITAATQGPFLSLSVTHVPVCKDASR